MVKTVKSWLGIEKQSKYVNEYFHTTNMKASIYMSAVIIVLELWMIIRMTRSIFTDHLQKVFWVLVEKYYTNYFVLLASGLIMLAFALKHTTQKTGSRWLGLPAIVVCGLAAAAEVRIIWVRTGELLAENNMAAVFEKYRSNYIQSFIVLISSLMLISMAISVMIHQKDRRWKRLFVLYLFSFVCIDFGIVLSANSYSEGGQMLTFLTMVLYVVCLLTWRPYAGVLILTVSYLIFYYKISHMLDLSTVRDFSGVVDFSLFPTGLGDGIKINGFMMWLSTVIFCFSNYHKTMTQARKDEDLESVNSHLRKISVIDELTGIHNMVYFRSEAQKLLKYVTTDTANVVYLFFDIENFKYYNEKNGFHAGNEILIKTAHIIEEEFGNSLVARYSDDHFVVLTKFDGADEKRLKLCKRIRELDEETRLSLKCGAYRPHSKENDPSLACDRARFACNSIKKHYDENYRLYDRELEEQFKRKQYIINNVDSAIENGYIRVYFQPVLSTEDTSIVGFEALARWQDPIYGLMSPSAFIELLEEHRQIHKVDICMIEQVCQAYRGAADNGFPFAPVSLNFSRLDFELCDIVGELIRLAKEYDVPPEYLDIEITESALSTAQDVLKKNMNRLQDAGYKVWLDDFGSGYSSLNVLKDFHFDVLKIDMKFLAGFSKNEKTKPILMNIVNLTKQLDMISLTEGVEEKNQFRFLASIGCDRVQGYLFSKPLPYGDICRKIESGELKISEKYRQGCSAVK